MDLNIIEGYIEVSGEKPVLITALHGFGTDLFKDVVDKLKELNLYEEFNEILTSRSAVDLFTGEIAFKAGIAEKCWVILPTISKVDKLNKLPIPDYNLNKPYARLTPLWKRVEQLIKEEKTKLIIDVHGMKDVNKWPDICIACNNYRTASKGLIEAIAETLQTIGLSVKIDYPFSGGALIKHFGSPPKVEAFSIEIKRNLRQFYSHAPQIMREVVRTALKFKF